MESKDAVSDKCMERYLRKSQERRMFNRLLVQEAFSSETVGDVCGNEDRKGDFDETVRIHEVQSLADVFNMDFTELWKRVEK